MFQCEGQCQKWVHPICFGETAEAIRYYEESGTPYVCMFCRPDTDCCKALISTHNLFVVDQSKKPNLLEELKAKNPERDLDSDSGNKRHKTTQ